MSILLPRKKLSRSNQCNWVAFDRHELVSVFAAQLTQGALICVRDVGGVQILVRLDSLQWTRMFKRDGRAVMLAMGHRDYKSAHRYQRVDVAVRYLQQLR